MLNLLLPYFLCGTLTGLLSGLLGIGGGVIGIPILLTIFDHQGISENLAIHMAIATLLATAIPTTAIAGYQHWKNRLIDFAVVKKMLPGLLTGCLIGTIISSYLDPFLLRKIFAIFLYCLAFQMFLLKEAKTIPIFLNKKLRLLITFLIGGFCSLLGLGGGILIVPYLRLSGISVKQAIAISTACILPVAIVGSISYALNGMQFATTQPLLSGFIYWPAFFCIGIASMIFAPLGANLTARLSLNKLNLIFTIFVIIAATKLFCI